MTQASKTIIIAEAGVNHNGQIDLALELVDRAAEAGADYVKFQTFKAKKLASQAAVKADYQKVNTGAGESQLEMLQRLEIGPDEHRLLIEQCNKRGIAFLSTAFDDDSLTFLAQDLRLRTLKLGSGELTNAPLLLAAARSGMNLLLSTGMGSLAEVEEALGVIAFGLTHASAPKGRHDFAEALFNSTAWDALLSRVTLLHCTTEYPAAIADTNLRAMHTMRAAFNLPVGYSDHTEGNAMSIAAVACGATVIEKHFTLDRTMDGPDHAASMEPEALASLVRGIRSVELGLGNGIKQPSTAEIRNRPIVRKILIANTDLPIGHILSHKDLTVKRSGTGMPPTELWDCIGRRLLKPLKQDDPILPKDLEWNV